jgi:hypothetical protein
VLLRALELDPVNIHTLTNYAVFLHRRKGELARAESFFRRALQVCLPGLLGEAPIDPGRKDHVGVVPKPERPDTLLGIHPIGLLKTSVILITLLSACSA